MAVLTRFLLRARDDAPIAAGSGGFLNQQLNYMREELCNQAITIKRFPKQWGCVRAAPAAVKGGQSGSWEKFPRNIEGKQLSLTNSKSLMVSRLQGWMELAQHHGQVCLLLRAGRLRAGGSRAKTLPVSHMPVPGIRELEARDPWWLLYTQTCKRAQLSKPKDVFKHPDAWSGIWLEIC